MKSMSKKVNVAVVGATGAVGEVMLSILAERKFPVSEVHAVASSRSVGKEIDFNGRKLVVEDLESFNFTGIDIGLFSPGASVSAIYAPKAAESGCVVIDNTSHFRYENDIPLVVPEVNPHAVAQYTNRGIIANPNCSTIQMMVALKPIHDAVGIERINVCTYQSVSGTGKKGIAELSEQTNAVQNGDPVQCKVYPKQIAFNVVPQIDAFQDNGYTKEEMKMVWETWKILEDKSIQVNPTTVRVPVFYGHSEAINIETRTKISVNEVKSLLKDMSGIIVMDDRKDGGYPTAVTDGVGTDSVYVGRIREDISHPRGINLWVVSDNIRKGAALNSIQIGEILVKHYL
ncbi:MAG: aspartate-semialdehyde dehydrogenase [Gammaproteobacteria bacterium]|jgi:aspartate-semialdehyde dehydrogenase